VDENEAVVEAAGGAKRLAIKVLDERSSGIYVCVLRSPEKTAARQRRKV